MAKRHDDELRDDALVRNTDDPAQVRRAERVARRRRGRELDELRAVLQSVHGRRVLWRVLRKCSVFGSTFSSDALVMAHRAGQQDLGHFLMSEIQEADEQALFKMMAEAKAAADNEALENAAARTPSADEPKE